MIVQTVWPIVIAQGIAAHGGPVGLCCFVIPVLLCNRRCYADFAVDQPHACVLIRTKPMSYVELAGFSPLGNALGMFLLGGVSRRSSAWQSVLRR